MLERNVPWLDFPRGAQSPQARQMLSFARYMKRVEFECACSAVLLAKVLYMYKHVPDKKKLGQSKTTLNYAVA